MGNVFFQDTFGKDFTNYEREDEGGPDFSYLLERKGKEKPVLITDSGATNGDSDFSTEDSAETTSKKSCSTKQRTISVQSDLNFIDDLEL
jgi:hypothetical protein